MKLPSQERNRPADSSSLQLSLLGGWRLCVDGKAVAGPAYAKGRALLAYLALEPRWHPRDELAERFWACASGPRASLRQVLANLRTVLHDAQASAPCLIVEREAVRFNPDSTLSLDVAAFTETPADGPGQLAQLEGMAALYQGEFLAGLSLPDCPEFEDWRQCRREALHRHALSLLSRLADGHAQIGQLPQALAFARRHVELEPWDEPAQRRVMNLCVATGHDLAACQHYESFARQLHAELGVQPEEATLALYQSLRAQRAVGALVDTEPPVTLPTLAAVERRQVTVLYCELVASASDPEELLAQLREPQRHAMALIAAQGGHLVQVHGGGFLAYFGYPDAREDAALMAVRVAHTVARCSGPEVQARLGVHTGLIVTSTDIHAPDAVGETSTHAIRLRLQCALGEVAVSASTRHLVEGYFHFDALDPLPVHHGAAPLSVSRLLGPSAASVRLEAAPHLSPFVGRDAEFDRLQAAWQAMTAAGGMQVVLIRGEAGIGKSRLVWRLQQSLSRDSHRLITLQCRREYRNTVLHPFTEYLAQICGFAEGDSEATRRARLAGHLASAHPQAGRDALCLLARLLGLPESPDDDPLLMSPQQEREHLQRLVLDMLAAAAARQVLMLVIEDLHWADPSTLALLERLLVTTLPGALGVLLTARPDFQPDWAARVLTLDLGPLSEHESARLAQSVRAAHPLAHAALHNILVHADGVPLFIEEMTRMLVDEAGLAQAHAHAAPIPTTLQDLLMARIDQLGDAKALAQCAATIGREFSRSLLLAVSPFAPSQLDAALTQLTASGLAYVLPGEARATYQFKHALVQEAAYHSQTRALRKQTHRRVAEALHPAVIAGIEAPERLARHFNDADMLADAATWWLQAGREAVARSAYPEALEQFHRALQAIAGLPDSVARDALELPVQMELGSGLLASQGYGSASAATAYLRALALGEKNDDALARFRSVWGLYLGSSSRTHHSDSMTLALQLLQLADKEDQAAWHIAARYACANSAYTLGRFAEACMHVQAARLHYAPALDDTLQQLFGENVMASALMFESWALWARDEADASEHAAAQALEIAHRNAHPPTLGFVYSLAGALYRMRDDVPKVAFYSEQLQALAATHGFALWQAVGGLLAGWTQAARGDVQGGAYITAAIDAIRAGVFVGAIMFFVEIQAGAYRHLGQYAALLRVADEGIEILQITHARHFEAELYRLKGECLLQLEGNVGTASAWFLRAEDCAEMQGATLLARRARESLARVEMA